MASTIDHSGSPGSPRTQGPNRPNGPDNPSVPPEEASDRLNPRDSGPGTPEAAGKCKVTERDRIGSSLDPTGARGKRRVTVRGQVTGATLTFGADDIDLSAVGQLVDRSHVLGVGRARALLGDGGLDGPITLAEGLDLLDVEIADRGAAVLTHGRSEDLAVPRRHEVAAALDRRGSLRVLALRRVGAQAGASFSDQV